jgi:phosphoribosylanthranilate isomerase
MTQAKAKICGLSTPEAVSAAFDGGAAYLGFVFFDKSPRNLTPEAAARLVAPVRGGAVKTVAVTVDPDDALIDRLMATMKPDLIQTHGKETPSRVRQIAERSGVGVIKAFSVSSASDVDQARAFETVAEAIRVSGAPLVDVSSGVERGPGLKDPALITAFLDAVKRL